MLPEINEQERLQVLYGYEIMDSLPEEDYNNITALASQICGTPISLISLIDDSRQWFKSSFGIDVKETPRQYAFCNHTIQNPREALVVPDTRKDDRFSGNPLVTGDPHVTFYAGAPLVDESGYALGSICVIDFKENDLNAMQIAALKILAKQVVTLMTLKKKNKTLMKLTQVLEQRNSELEDELRLLKIQTK